MLVALIACHVSFHFLITLITFFSLWTLSAFEWSKHCIKSWKYCKRCNIREFRAKPSEAWIQKPAKVFAIFCMQIWDMYVGVVYWPCVLMQMGNILENVRGLLCFHAAQLHVNVLTFCSTKMTSEHLLSATLTTPECFCAAKRKQLIPRH